MATSRSFSRSERMGGRRRRADTLENRRVSLMELTNLLIKV